MNIASMLLRILAILGAIAAVVVYFLIGDTKQRLEADLEETQTRLRQTEANLTSAETEREEVREQLAATESDLEEAEARAASLENQLTRVRQQLEQASEVISAREEESQNLQTEAARIRRELLDERNRVAQLQESIDEQDASAMQSNVQQLEQQLLETERRLQEMQQQSAEQQASAPQGQERPESLRGEVTDVGDRSAFVVIDLGAEDGVERDTSILIRRGGRFIGRATVSEVHDDVSVARVLPGSSNVRRGDIAITLD